MNRYVRLANPPFFEGYDLQGRIPVWTRSTLLNDLNVPPEAQEVIVTVYLRGGELDLLDGDGQKAGFCSGRHTTHVVKLSGTAPTRDFLIEGSALIDKIEVLGWR